MARLKASDLPDAARKIFFHEGLDVISENQPPGKSPANVRCCQVRRGFAAHAWNVVVDPGFGGGRKRPR